MHYRFYLFILACCCLASAASAQEFTLRGVISKKSTINRIGSVMVKDLKTQNMMLSDDLGWFAIKTNIGDTLLFTKEDYTPQKIVVQDQSDLPVYMQPVILLSEVKIVGQTKKQEINSILNDYKKQGTFYNGKPPALSFLANPITGIYELFGKTPNRAKRFAQNAQSELETAEVNRRYTVSFVKQFTKLPNDSLARKFMNYYTPSYEDLKGWNDYEMIKHTLKAYDFYKNNADKDRLEEIFQPSFLRKDSTVNLSNGPVIK